MAKFLVYIFESGLCLSLFYLGYITFFRKETYFTFNRLYLVASMVLAIMLPLLPISLSVNNTEYMSGAVEKLGDFRNYYEELILITDPEYAVAHGQEQQKASANTVINNSESIGASSSFFSSLSISSLIFYIYIAGLLFYTARLFILFYNLSNIIRRNKTIVYKGFTVVLIKEDMPSFSFLKWIFINKEALKPNEFEQVISHEKVHVDQRHSVDLLLAHLITMFQWFNPLTWRIQKSIKTCHEYIADRQVIDQGHELFDYQSLLLSQLISIRSVELVNNFNLLSIKKRIAMMNKNKSGRKAQLKALLVVPMLLLSFFFFADITGKEMMVEKGKSSIDMQSLLGNWEAVDKKANQIQLLEFKGSQLNTVKGKEENTAEIDVYEVEIKNNKLILSNSGVSKKVKCELNDNQLFVEWEDNTKHEYVRSEANSFVLLESVFQKVSIPTAKSVKPYDADFILLSLTHSRDAFFINGKKQDIDNIDSQIKKVLSSMDNKEFRKKSTLLEIDKEVQMREVDKIKIALRQNNLLKLGYLAKADKSYGADGMTALFNLLPPLDAKLIDESELKNKGIGLFKISHASKQNYSKVSEQLRKFILNNKKYVMLYEYNNNTTYNDYIKTIDLVYVSIGKLRDEEAMLSGKSYSQLSDEEQKVIRKKYPITLTQRNIDVK